MHKADSPHPNSASPTAIKPQWDSWPTTASPLHPCLAPPPLPLTSSAPHCTRAMQAAFLSVTLTPLAQSHRRVSAANTPSCDANTRAYWTLQEWCQPERVLGKGHLAQWAPPERETCSLLPTQGASILTYLLHVLPWQLEPGAGLGLGLWQLPRHQLSGTGQLERLSAGQP